MKIHNRFIQAVKFLNRIIPKQTTLQILTKIKVKQEKTQIIFEASDLDSILTICLPIWSEVTGQYLVESNFLLNSKEKIATKVTPKEVHFNNVISSNTDIKEFPNKIVLKNPTWTGKINHKEFAELGKVLKNYVSKDFTSRISFTGVSFRGTKICSTDGHILFRKDLKLKPGLDCIFPTTFFDCLNDKFIIDDELELIVYQKMNWAILKGMSFEYQTKLVEGPYPQYEKVIPKQNDIEFHINRGELLDIIAQANKYSEKANHSTGLSLQKSLFQINVINKELDFKFNETLNISIKKGKKWDGVNINGIFLHQILTNIKTENVIFKMTDSKLAPISIIPENDKTELFILMPVKNIEIKEEKQTQKQTT